MKIKGDWADHIYPDKPSYRFKLPSSSSFLGMTSFSVQHPKTRNYLSEWILHKFADRIGLLSTKYEFINVCINGYKMGVYALEEHFEKHIVENRNRREGPILKLNENGTWKYREKTYNHSLEHKYPDYQASFIDAFKGGKIAKSSTLSNQFNEGLKLVQLFREGHADISDIFDLDLLAKYYVLIEISGNYHALIWHNRRFYFNPVTQKLEHIFFDAIPYPKRKESVIKSIIENRSKEDNLVMDNAIIMSKPFKEKYFQYLKEYTDKRFLEKLFDEHKSDLEVFQEAILSENPSYDFSLQDFYNRTKLLRDEMDDLSDYWEAEIAKAKSIEYWMERDVFSTFSGSPVIDGVSVNAYIDTNEKFCEILVENYHINNIEIVSVQYQKDSLPISLKNKITLAGSKDQTASAKFTLASAPVAIYFSEKSNPNILHTAQIIPWPKPSGITTVMSLKKKFNSNSSLYTIKGQNLHFHKSCQIEELIYIPSKYKVSVEPGITIDFKNGGGLIVNNSFSCIGTKQNPILFMSTGGGSQGLTIINADSVNIDYSKFENLSNLNFEHWQLTGAVTIYESPTTIKNTVVSNNDSEDALNIIRSNFNISELLIENTFSDGFDADFCTGIIKNSYFKNTGNDCIDFSGSVVRIDNISILNSGDKGISGGEASKLTVNNTIINGARMGIASKDASLITVSGGNISNTNYDFASFQKKSTYGPSNLIVLDEISDIGENKILVEKGSIITINDVKYKGQSVLNIEELYKDFIKKK